MRLGKTLCYASHWLKKFSYRFLSAVEWQKLLSEVGSKFATLVCEDHMWPIGMILALTYNQYSCSWPEVVSDVIFGMFVGAVLSLMKPWEWWLQKEIANCIIPSLFCQSLCQSRIWLFQVKPFWRYLSYSLHLRCLKKPANCGFTPVFGTALGLYHIRYWCLLSV